MSDLVGNPEERFFCIAAHILSAMFGVSKYTFENLTAELIHILFVTFKIYIKWPSFRERRKFRGKQEKIRDALDAIDGTVRKKFTATR